MIHPKCTCTSLSHIQTFILDGSHDQPSREADKRHEAQVGGGECQRQAVEGVGGQAAGQQEGRQGEQAWSCRCSRKNEKFRYTG